VKLVLPPAAQSEPNRFENSEGNLGLANGAGVYGEQTARYPAGGVT
jgi:hypothetical protein